MHVQDFRPAAVLREEEINEAPFRLSHVHRVCPGYQPGSDVCRLYSASPGDIEILVNGAAQARYGHQGRLYVEALKGREYAIRIRNPYGVRVAVALSVDGLNTIDARQTTATAARKWVLAPYETVTISGWQTSRTEARRFEFTTEEHSYGQALGKTANLGVISAVFFKERIADRMTEATRDALPSSPSAAQAPPAADGKRERSEADSSRLKKQDNEYAATGMGGRTGHVVEQVWLDLEDTPAQTVNIRYEYRTQLVRLGVLKPVPTAGAVGAPRAGAWFRPGILSGAAETLRSKMAHYGQDRNQTGTCTRRRDGELHAAGATTAVAPAGRIRAMGTTRRAAHAALARRPLAGLWHQARRLRY